MLVAGNLVRWLNSTGSVGVVRESDTVGRRVRIRFDSGDERSFGWPCQDLQRVSFAPGQQVELVGSGQSGVVDDAMDAGGVISYGVNLPDGSRKRVLEDSVRAAVILDPVERLRAGELDTPRSCDLRVSATRLAFAHQTDELSSLSNSRVEIKPHQVGVLHRIATTYPHRFLLADEVGLGKTVEAGLTIKELKARGIAKRVLILAPSGLVGQWQTEMDSKFNEKFEPYTRTTIDYLEGKHPGENVWTIEDNVIASTTFASWNEERARQVALAGWDLVVVDEAHHARS